MAADLQAMVDSGNIVGAVAFVTDVAVVKKINGENLLQSNGAAEDDVIIEINLISIKKPRNNNARKLSYLGKTRVLSSIHSIAGNNLRDGFLHHFQN